MQKNLHIIFGTNSAPQLGTYVFELNNLIHLKASENFAGHTEVHK